MPYKFTKSQTRFFRFLLIFLIALLLFKLTDYALSEIADRAAYSDAEAVSAEEWNGVYGKVRSNYPLSESDYRLIFTQTGLGKPAVDALMSGGRSEEIEDYYDFYTKDKDYLCIREGVLACHEHITDANGKLESNPPFADLQNGDIIITLSIHSLGWRHGHAAIVTNAGDGTTAEAVRIGEKSDFGSAGDWQSYPLVAVLRLRDGDKRITDDIARFAEENLLGLDYALSAGIIGGRDTDKIPVSTQCAHFVWFAYKAYGIDLDSDGGRVITPYDILHSDSLEIVQIYGNII